MGGVFLQFQTTFPPCTFIAWEINFIFIPSQSEQRLGQALCTTLSSLTYLAPARSDAVEEAEVVDLAVPVLDVQLGKAKVQPVAAGNGDLPLAHAVVGVRPWVSQRGQRPTGGTEHRRATAITCRVTNSRITLYFHTYIHSTEHITNT